MSTYYNDKLGQLKDIFGAGHVEAQEDHVTIDGKVFPVIDDVIILLDETAMPPLVRRRLSKQNAPSEDPGFSEDVQFSFGAEWTKYPDILPEHRDEFNQYFDLVDIDSLAGARSMDLGCGIGRWSYFLKDICGEMILVDFSEAIFVARKNLRGSVNCVFFMADITKLPFRSDAADFILCLGVLHHLPMDALKATRYLKGFAPRALIYLYYALDNRPVYFRALLAAATMVRLAASRIRNERLRSIFTWLVAALVYKPFIVIGQALGPLGLSSSVPLYEGYRGKSLGRIQQDVYDRFFTTIEQRVSRSQIMALRDSYSKITVSENIPYWHFLLER
ncbi:MAG: class I SAM-dependent methyltransferase [Nitrospinota bacterium]|nr:class I SAM-dependent methyltransferase [Nitrospinota bacterium]